MLTGLAMALLSAQRAAADFSLSFQRGAIPHCTTDKPNKVGNPKSVLKDVPEGTNSFDFCLKGLNRPRNVCFWRIFLTLDGCAKSTPYGTITLVFRLIRPAIHCKWSRRRAMQPSVG